MDIHHVTQDASVVDMLTMSPSSVLVLPGVSNVSVSRINSTYKRDDLENIFQYLEIITSPLVSVVGTVLNLLTVGAFLSKSLRNTSCCLYLAVRSLAVFGFLVSMFIAWTNTFASLYQRDGICQITIFLSFFCPFVSVWMVVIISLENFIRIAQPARVGRLCTPRVAKIVILIVTLVGLMVCHFPFWIIEVKNGRCDPKPHLMKTVLILNYMDTVLTMVFPVVLMIIVVPLVGLTAINAYERKKRLTSELSSRKRSNNEMKSSPETRVTHLLLSVSLVFLLFQMPFHCIRIKLFFLQLSKLEPSRTDQILHHIFRMIFNFDTVLSCAVYLVFGDNFRRVFCKLYFSRCMGALRSDTSANDSSNHSHFTTLASNSIAQNDRGSADSHALLPAQDLSIRNAHKFADLERYPQTSNPTNAEVRSSPYKFLLKKTDAQTCDFLEA